MDRLIRVSKQTVFLILDNLKVHHGKLAASWLEKHKDKIEVFFLPPYALGYNLDEYLNHALKISVHSGHLPIPRKISVIRFSHSCKNYSIVRLLCPAFFSSRLFPIFIRRSNISLPYNNTP